ncbi:MAG: hypothetical protein AAF722_08505 [Cyanobacteria bacterium P01_C01_bin.70]
MSEGNVPPRSHDADAFEDAQGRLPLSPLPQPAADEGWEMVPFLGLPKLTSPVDSSDSSGPSATVVNPKEGELQSRIADLNQCNEVLLSRVHQLEEALERSQQALQQEVERSQRMTEEEKIAAAQTHSTAQLLSELEQANESLKRQTLLSETLTAQLAVSEERAQRLESECAILRKRKAERAQQLQAAEANCADLRSRLQRQQQYTLQFKAALEKSLDTSALPQTSQTLEPTPPAFAADASSDLTAAVPAAPQTIGLPRSESIRPWSASEAQAPTDPQLLSLMRVQPGEASTPAVAPATQPFPTNLSQLETQTSPAAAAVAEAAAPSVPHDAEQQLWQDVERIIDQAAATAVTEPEVKAPTQPTAAANQPPMAPVVAAPPEVAEAAAFTEPIPWGAPIKVKASESAETTAEQQSSEPAVHPEPVGQGTEPPLDAAPATTDFEPPSEAYRPSPQVAAAANVPALEAMQTAPQSPSPLVHPLRPTQRKRKSLSAVELPNFPPLPKVQNQ